MAAIPGTRQAAAGFGEAVRPCNNRARLSRRTVPNETAPREEADGNGAEHRKDIPGFPRVLKTEQRRFRIFQRYRSVLEQNRLLTPVDEVVSLPPLPSSSFYRQ